MSVKCGHHDVTGNKDKKDGSDQEHPAEGRFPAVKYVHPKRRRAWYIISTSQTPVKNSPGAAKIKLHAFQTPACKINYDQ